MAAQDYKSSLPVRSEADGLDARVQVKLVDKSNPGTQQMTVDTDSNAHVEMHGNKPDGSDVVMRLSEEGAPNPDGVYNVTNNSVPATSGVTAQVRNATAAASRQTMQPTAKRGVADTDTVSLDISLHDENGDKYTTSNPLPVVLSNEEIGTAVHAHDESATPATGNGGTSSYTYTVAGTPLTLKRVIGAASGRFKMIVEIGTAGSPLRKYTLFNSTSNPNCILDIPKNYVVAVGDVVKVTFTNMDQDDFTCYTMIEGTLGA